MKVLKNILKWLVCVFLTFTVIFTLMHSLEIVEGSYAMLKDEYMHNDDEFINKEGAKTCEEMTNGFFLESSDEELKECYKEYPAGTTYMMSIFAQMIGYGETAILSLVLSLIMGTALYLLMNKDKKGIKIVITLYILSIVILGFVEGVQSISGDNLNLLEKWIFPDEYILPVTIVFGLVIAVRIIRQKDIAKKLNEKLKENKLKKSK